MQGVRRLLQSHISEERVDGPQPDVPRASTVFASAFQVIEEETNERCIEVFDPNLGWHFAEPFLGKLQKQTEAVAISGNGMRARLSLAEQAIGEKRLKKRRKADGNHSCTCRWIIRSVAS
jgi:hypothetical protein